MRIIRVLVIALALVICAWFAVGARQAHETDAAAAIVVPGIGQSTADLSHARALIDSGGFLYPGQDIHLLRADQLIDQHRYARAETVIEPILHSEPQNLDGWIDIAKVFILAPRVAAHSGLTAAQVRAHIARLDPIDARHL